MILTSILLSSGEWLFKYIHRQEDGSIVIRYQGRCISLEYVNEEFPYWKEVHDAGCPCGECKVAHIKKWHALPETEAERRFRLSQ